MLGVGGLAALDVTTEHADAQGDGIPELEAANERSIRSIKQGTEAWNLVAKYLAEPGQRVAVRSPA